MIHLTSKNNNLKMRGHQISKLYISLFSLIKAKKCRHWAENYYICYLHVFEHHIKMSLRGYWSYKKKFFNNTPTKKCFIQFYLKKNKKKISKKNIFIRSIFRPFLPKKEFCHCNPFCEVTIWTIKTRFVAFASELSAL